MMKVFKKEVIVLSWCVLALTTITGAIASLDMAKIRQEGGRTITSSTLAWVEGHHRGHPHAVPISEDDPTTVWCRAQKHGLWVSGAMHRGVCTVPFLGSPLRAVDKYEILISVNGSAKVRYMVWDRYTAPPHNAIAAQSKRFLAVHTGDNGLPLSGFLSPEERRVHLVDGDKVEVVDTAMVLVEDEPVKYDLRGIILDSSRTETKREDQVLAEAKLLNPGPSRQRVVEAREVMISQLAYWGRVKGTYTGLSATVVNPAPDNEEKELTWGVQNELDRMHEELLEYDLPPGTGVRVKMIGDIRKTEAPYSATLTAIYEDGSQISRVIEGFHMDERLIILRAEYSRPYYIHNNTELDIPEQSSVLYKSTTTTTTTTTSTTSTTTPEPPKLSMVGPQKPKSDSLSTTSEREVIVTLNSASSSTVAPGLVFLTMLSIVLTVMSLSSNSH